MAVKVCPSCHESNREQNLLCVVCSTSLRDVPLEGTPDGQKEFSGVLGPRSSCWYCGERTQEDALTCGVCGSTLLRDTSGAAGGAQGRDYTVMRTGPSGFALLLLALATLLIPIVGLIVGGCMVFSDDADKRSAGTGLLVFGLVMLALHWFL